MSEATSASARLDPERVLSFALGATVRGKSAPKVAKACRCWHDAADALEASATHRAGLYPINGHGKAYGERPGDRDALEAAKLLRTLADRLLIATAPELRPLPKSNRS